MIQLKSRFGTEKSDCSPIENIALRIVAIVVELARDIARDIESAFVQDIYTCVDLLNARRISSADAARVVAICADVPVQLERLRHDTIAVTIREMLNEFKNWPPDEELGGDTFLRDLEPLDEFGVVGVAVSALGNYGIKGRFLRLDKGTSWAFGLKGSSHPGKTVHFSTPFAIVRKVIKRQS